MRIHYCMIPTDYTDELEALGKYKKASCFRTYCCDVSQGKIKKYSEYAKHWGDKNKPMSKGTLYKWIQEFTYEIERFYNAWSLKNQQHYQSVKKQSERKVNAYETFNTSKQPEKRELSETHRTASERKVNNNNIYDYDTRMRKREIDDLYSIYRLNTKNAGKKLEALEVYKGLDLPKGISYRDIQRAAILYLNDPEIQSDENGRKIVYSLANFLRNEIYLAYIPHRLRIDLDDRVVIGEYDRETETLRGDDGIDYRLSTSRLAELLSDKKLEFVFGVAA